MLLVHPKASIPIVQVSVLSSEDPSEHFKMGQALSKLRDSNVAIVGSGFASFHNYHLLFRGLMKVSDLRPRAEEFSSILSDAVMQEDVNERKAKLENWRNFPHAYDMHPRGGADHFMPLIVCAGAAGEGKAEAFSDEFNGLSIWSYYWS
jgi:aromatic ring-opening dioxygenase catalytic subunit (LigB family)